MVQVDNDILLPVSYNHEEAAFFLLGSIANEGRDTGVTAAVSVCSGS